MRYCLKYLAEEMFGVKKCTCFFAENLDIIGSNVEEIMKNTKAEIDSQILQTK